MHYRSGLLAVDAISCGPSFPENPAPNAQERRRSTEPPVGGARERQCGVIAMKNVDVLGWISSFILLVTLIRQVYVQWKSQSVAGVSKWLFIGQLTASTGYTMYSLLLHNWVYVTSNIAILLTAVVGEGLYLRNRRMAESQRQSRVEATPRRPAVRSANT
jgi:uncharacterized protein with PQ loop repeat